MERLIAKRMSSPVDEAGLPADPEWQKSQPVSFCTDWCGNNPDPERETEARILWSPEFVFVRFRCRFREIFVYDGANSRRDKLWERDVAEIFIRPGTEDPLHYKEFEISPNGDWLDLDINHGEKSLLLCDMKTRVRLDRTSRTWTAEMALPFPCLAQSFDPAEEWRLNLFRIEGPDPRRFYSAWRPTRTPRPNFHVPEAFGTLHFAS